MADGWGLVAGGWWLVAGGWGLAAGLLSCSVSTSPLSR
jgi:hypothetical protein